MSIIQQITGRGVAGGSTVPTTGQMRTKELAYLEASDIGYYAKGIDGGSVPSSIVPAFGAGAFDTLATAQTITGQKTFTQPLNIPDPVSNGQAASVNWTNNAISNNLNVISFSRVYNENAFGINGGTSVIEFLQVTQTVNDNCFSIELHVLSYQNSNNPTTPNTYSATYQINSMRDQTAGAWQILYPTSASHSRNDAVNLYPQIEIKVTGLVMNIRERRKNYGVNPGFMDIGYRCLTKNGQGAQVFEFINESSDPEPTVIYRNNTLNCYISDAVDAVITSPVNGESLKWNAATSKWINNFITPHISAYWFSVQTLPSGSATQLILDGISWDTASNYNTGTGTFTASIDGFYSVKVCSTAASTLVLSSYLVAIYQSGSLACQGSFVQNATATQLASVATKTLRLNAGQTVTVLGKPTGTGTITLNFSTLTIDYLGT